MATHYVSSSGTGTWEQSLNIDTPCSLSTAATNATAGDAVYLRAGTYQPTSQVIFAGDGTEANPIIITCYQNEAVTIDGQNTYPAQGSAYGLIHLTGDWITFGGNATTEIEVTRSFEDGVITTGYHPTVQYVYSHHNYECGVQIRRQGGGINNFVDTYGTIDHCRVTYVGMRRMYGGVMNPGCCSAFYSKYVTIKNCTVWDCWGEGISAYNASNVTMQDNVCYDCIQIYYLNDSQYVTLKRCIGYVTGGGPTAEEGVHPYGIMCGNEGTSTNTDYTVINNLIMGGFRCFGAGTTDVLHNLLVAYNVFMNANNPDSDYCVVFSSGTCDNTVFKNNIIIQDDDTPIGTNGTTGLTRSNNCWSKAAPSSLQGTGDVTDDPDLAKTGGTGPGELTADYFKLLGTSPCIGAAEVLAAVTEDYWQNQRGDDPDIGSHEYGAGQTTVRLRKTSLM